MNRALHRSSASQVVLFADSECQTERCDANRPNLRGRAMLAFIYVKASKQVGDPEHLTVFATADGAAKALPEYVLE